jgi:hypothetical protein
MFDIFDLLIVTGLCSIVIFCVVYVFKYNKKVEVKKNVIEDDISQIFYDESIYKIESCNDTELVDKVEEDERLNELGIISPVDEGGYDSGDDDGGFFMPDDNNNGEDEEDDEDIPAPPRTWEDFMGNTQEEAQSPEKLSAYFQGKGKNGQSSIKDMVASVREEIVQKPLSDEEFKKKYFSRLVDEE